MKTTADKGIRCKDLSKDFHTPKGVVLVLKMVINGTKYDAKSQE